MTFSQSPRSRGFTLLELMIVVTTTGLLAAIAVPNMIIARSNAQAKGCISNLRHIDAAKQEWALENNRPSSDTPAGSDLRSYLGRASGALPFCPLDNTKRFDASYTINDLYDSPVCQQDAAKHFLVN